MKRGALRRRAKDISLVFIVLVCATLVLWSWDTTPSSAFLPPDSHFLKLEPGLTMTLYSLSGTFGSVVWMLEPCFIDSVKLHDSEMFFFLNFLFEMFYF